MGEISRETVTGNVMYFTFTESGGRTTATLQLPADGFMNRDVDPYAGHVNGSTLLPLWLKVQMRGSGGQGLLNCFSGKLSSLRPVSSRPICERFLFRNHINGFDQRLQVWPDLAAALL